MGDLFGNNLDGAEFSDCGKYSKKKDKVIKEVISK